MDPTYLEIFSSEISRLRQEYADDNEGIDFETYVISNISLIFTNDSGDIIFPEKFDKREINE
jgi:signal peptidase I